MAGHNLDLGDLDGQEMEGGDVKRDKGPMTLFPVFTGLLAVSKHWRLSRDGNDDARPPPVKVLPRPFWGSGSHGALFSQF